MMRRLALPLVLALLALSATPIAGPAAAQSDEERFFGAVQAIANPSRAQEAGVQWERLIFHWGLIQPEGRDDWSTGYYTDAQIRAEAQRGFELMGVALYTPRWASSTPENHRFTNVPAGLYLDYDDPDNYWGQFMQRLAREYRGTVDTWILWNEPDQYNPEVRNTWDGSIGDMYQLMKVGYLAVKKGNPQARVVMPGFTYFWDKEYGRQQYLESLLDQAAQDPTAAANNWYFDAVDAHVYGNPLNAFTVPTAYKRMLAARGLDKPVWIIESNAVPYDDPASPLPPIPFRASMDQQASYVIQAFALGRAAGLERMSIYKMVDEFPEGQGDLYGLVRNDGSIRPAFRAYQTVRRYLSDPTSVVYLWDGSADPPSEAEITQLLQSVVGRHQWPWPAAVNRVVVERGTERVTVIWNASGSPVTARVQAEAERAAVIDKFGNQTGELVAQNGEYILDLAPSSNNTDPREPVSYLVGGEPLLLVEQVEPLPTVVDAPIQVIWPHAGAPIGEADRANVSASLLLPGTRQAPPCRWNPTVELMASVGGGEAQRVAIGARRMVSDGGLTYAIWYFDNVDVSAARQGATIDFWVEVDGIQTNAPHWSYGASVSQPLAWQQLPTASCS